MASAQNIILYQNEPNPFGNSTIIRYYVPENISPFPSGRAGDGLFMVFYDEFGKEIHREKLNRGDGMLEIDAAHLASGIYTYRIVVNEKVLDTKKMVKSR